MGRSLVIRRRRKRNSATGTAAAASAIRAGCGAPSQVRAWYAAPKKTTLETAVKAQRARKKRRTETCHSDPQGVGDQASPRFCRLAVRVLAPRAARMKDPKF